MQLKAHVSLADYWQTRQTVLHLFLLPIKQQYRTFIAASKQLLKQLFQNGFSYHKCSILFSEITADDHTRQLDLFTDAYDQQRRNTEKTLMNTIDQINRRFPSGISLIATGTRKKWQYTPQKLSPRYTTDWNELPQVKCI